MLGDPDEDDDVLAFGSTRHLISRRIKIAITVGGVIAAAATTCAVFALGGTHSTASTGTATTATIQQDDAAQFQGPWSLDLSSGTVAHIARPGSGGSVATGQPTVMYNPCDKPRR